MPCFMCNARKRAKRKARKKSSPTLTTSPSDNASQYQISGVNNHYGTRSGSVILCDGCYKLKINKSEGIYDAKKTERLLAFWMKA